MTKVLNLILMGPFLHVGIALATAFSSWVNAGVMAYILHKRGHLVIDTHTIKRMLKILASAIGMGFL